MNANLRLRTRLITFSRLNSPLQENSNTRASPHLFQRRLFPPLFARAYPRSFCFCLCECRSEPIPVFACDVRLAASNDFHQIVFLKILIRPCPHIKFYSMSRLIFPLPPMKLIFLFNIYHGHFIFNYS
jgi:hypothetical protein